MHLNVPEAMHDDINNLDFYSRQMPAPTTNSRNSQQLQRLRKFTIVPLPFIVFQFGSCL